MLKVCPNCGRMTIEYDPHQGMERCLNRHCGWVNRDKLSMEWEKEVEKDKRSDLATGIASLLQWVTSTEGQDFRAKHPEAQEAYGKMILGISKIREFLRKT